MNDYYWILRYGDYKDLKTVMIPPASVEQVKRRWNNGEPIHLSNGSIPSNQIRGFEQSDKLFSTQSLLEAASQVFDEPLLSEDGSIATRWVKKIVTRNRWEKYFSNSPGYKYLDDADGNVWVAFRLPIHEINQATTPYCDDNEILRLTHG